MKRLFCSLLLSAIAFAAVAAAPPPEKLLPADAIVVLTVPDYARSSAAWSQWPAHQLWADPAMKAFKDKFVNKFKSDVIAPLEKEMGVKFADYSGLAQGQVAFGLTLNAGDGGAPPQPGFLLLVDAKEKSGALKTNLAALKNKWVDGGKQVRVEKIRDVEFTTYLVNPEDAGKTFDKVFPNADKGGDDAAPKGDKKGGKKFELLVGQSDSLLVVGNSAKDIEKVLVSQSGGSVPTLSEQPLFASSYNALFRDSQAYGWVNLKSIIDTALKQIAKEGGQRGGNQQMPGPEKIFSALGLTGLQSLAFNLRDSGDGCLASLNVSVPEAGRKGLFKIFAFEAKDAAPPPFVPADATKFSRFRLDLSKTWNALESALNDAVPQMAGFVKLVIDNAGKDKDPNFDLRKNLIDNLGDDVISYEKAPRKQTLADLGSPPSLYLVGSPKAETVAASIKALTAVMPQQKFKEREFLGRKVYSMALPSQPAPGGGKPVERTLHYAASGSYVVLSTDVAMLEEYLRSSDGSGKSLRETPGLADAAQKVGGMGTGLFGYENQAETMRSAFEILKKESGSLSSLFSGTPLAARMGDDNNKFKEWVDFSLLPSYDKVAKYFYISVFSGAVNSEGIQFKIYTPNPPQLKK